MKLFIKNMVSSRCKIAVRDELKKLGLHSVFVDLGEVEIMEDVSENGQWDLLKVALLNLGFELMDDKRSILIEKIKNSVMEMVHTTHGKIKVNFSNFLSEKLKHDYTYLANLFSEIQGISIQQFIMEHKVSRIKELMSYGDLTISEIAWKMNYSSIAHLSNQFKKITGLSPSHFKKLKNQKRTPIEDIGNLGNEHQVQFEYAVASCA